MNEPTHEELRGIEAELAEIEVAVMEEERALGDLESSFSTRLTALKELDEWAKERARKLIERIKRDRDGKLELEEARTLEVQLMKRPKALESMDEFFEVLKEREQINESISELIAQRRTLTARRRTILDQVNNTLTDLEGLLEEREKLTQRVLRWAIGQTRNLGVSAGGWEAERRTATRVNIEIPLKVGRGSDSNAVTTENLSTLGVFVATRDILKVGRAVLLTFLTEGGEKHMAEGEVVWKREENIADEEKAGMGIRFTHVPEATKRVIEDHIRSKILGE